MKILALTGRILFSILFLVSAPDHFHSDMVRRAADNGLLFAPILVPASGVAVFIGGLSVLLGWKVRWCVWLLAAFLISDALLMHRFWSVQDPTTQQQQQLNFMKDLTMVGGACLIAYFGAGPWSIDSLTQHAPAAWPAGGQAAGAR